ncbi:MAG TPA: peptidoglycan-associated lipoprotein Pal [Candidatus Angelobacter sp.]|nr:peptidoglycan-associated lipoprotein Pal [Candidatus Angelobacter sp.]
MKLASRSLYRAALLTALSAAVLSFGCAKKATPPPPPPAAAPAPARPTVTLQASPSSINKGDSATLSWNSTDATQLSIDQGVGAVTAQGSTKVTPSDSTTYTITASGPGGSASATASVSVNAPPPPQPAPTPAPAFGDMVHDAYFDYDKADIRADARDALSKTADYLKSEPSIKVTVEGHCDERGSTEYNLGLGDRRANAVKQYLVSLGVPADRISTVSFGKEKPFCMDHNEACWQQNRRGHFVKAN